MDNGLKHTVNTTHELLNAKKWNVHKWTSQSPDLNPAEHAVYLLKTKLKVPIDCKGFTSKYSK